MVQEGQVELIPFIEIVTSQYAMMDEEDCNLLIFEKSLNIIKSSPSPETERLSKASKDAHQLLRKWIVPLHRGIDTVTCWPSRAHVRFRHRSNTPRDEIKDKKSAIATIPGETSEPRSPPRLNSKSKYQLKFLPYTFRNFFNSCNPLLVACRLFKCGFSTSSSWSTFSAVLPGCRHLEGTSGRFFLGSLLVFFSRGDVCSSSVHLYSC